MTPTFYVFLGPPGVGKGTQAKILARKTGLAHISSGDLFRENIKKDTELGKLAQSYIKKGELVPDDVTIAMIRDRFSHDDCKRGAILDGFPRTPVQAEALQALLKEFGGTVNAVPFITVPEEVIIERLSGRWTCRANGHIFHQEYNAPKITGICDYDGSELYQRDDDKAETVYKRIKVYLDQTTPLINYFKERGKLIEIIGAQPIETVFADLSAALGLEQND